MLKDLQIPVEQFVPCREVDSERVEGLQISAGSPQPDLDSAAGYLVQHCEILSESDRVFERQSDDRCPQMDPLGPCRGSG